MKKQPIRIEKVEKYKKHISRVEQDKGRKLRPGERLAVIYDRNFLENNTEQEEEEKGLSRKELYLILYDVGDVIKTISYYGETDEDDEYDERIVDEKQRERLIALQYFNEWKPLLKKTIQVMRYFDKSNYKKMQRAKNDSEYHYFNINWKRTRKGAYYYYNMINEEDLEQSLRHLAKCSLGNEKLRNKLYDIAERNEREEEEIKRGRRKKTSSQEYYDELMEKLNRKRKKDDKDEHQSNNNDKERKKDNKLDKFF